jgi:hypothetical protein
VLRELKHERALDVGAAVTAAREFEVALADGAYLLEEFQDFVAFHGHAGAARDCILRASAGSLMAAGGSVKRARVEEWSA